MKRKKPLKRGKGLSADPEKVRAFQRRAREKAAENARERPRKALPRVSASNSGRGRRTPPDAPREMMTGLAWRRAVWDLDEGRCVGCGKAVGRDDDQWVWQAHHPIEKQKLPPGRRRDPRGGVVTCRRCHERHTSRTAVIPGDKLPRRVREFALELGTWAVDVLDRAHPPGDGDQSHSINGRS